METAVVIPNYNGIDFIGKCLDSLERQYKGDFTVYVVDNGSEDGSTDEACRYSFTKLIRLAGNTGFTGAVNTGIKAAEKDGAEYVILLNNDTEAEDGFVSALVKAIKSDDRIFSAQAKMLKASEPEMIDDAGDFYCALGWTFARGYGKDETKYNNPGRIFYSCGGAAVYSVKLLKETGLFDNAMFAYLEDADIGWRSRIYGYKNVFAPEARVRHVGSGASGSRYNEFKIDHSSANSIYIIYKNMPLLQFIINIPFLAAGFLIKILFFALKGYAGIYLRGLKKGFAVCSSEHGKAHKIRFKAKYLPNYILIQIELWVNIFRRIAGFF